MEPRAADKYISVAEFSEGGYNSGELRDDSVAILQAYFDDSSDGKRQRYSAVGGLMGNSAQWDRFDLLWAAATNKLEHPFHATDCESQGGQFDGWQKHECDTLIKNLVEIVFGAAIHSYGSIVPIADYRAVFTKSEEYDPYFLALRHTIVNMAHIGALRTEPWLPPAGVKIWHEDSQLSWRVHQIYSEFKHLEGWGHSRYLEGFAVGPKKIMALQGADLFAREAFKHADNWGKRPTRKPVKEMRDQIAFHLWTRECLEYLRDHGGNTAAGTAFWGKDGSNPPQMIRLWRDMDLGAKIEA